MANKTNFVFSGLISFLMIWWVYANALQITWLQVTDNKNISIEFNQDFKELWSESEIKFLEDLMVVSSSLDEKNPKKINIEILAPLEKEKSYSIVSVSEWLDISMDFNNSWNSEKIMNTNILKDEISIEYISILPNNTIELFLNQNIPTGAILDFKFFKELKSKSISKDWQKILVNVYENLTPKKAHIAILSLKDTTNSEILVENGLYDFTTPETINSIPENIVPVSEWSNIQPIENTPPTTEEIALNATATPPTGTKTNILLFIAFLSTFWFIYFNKKIKSV